MSFFLLSKVYLCNVYIFSHLFLLSVFAVKCLGLVDSEPSLFALYHFLNLSKSSTVLLYGPRTY